MHCIRKGITRLTFGQVFLTILGCATAQPASRATDFTLGPLVAGPGEMQSGFLPVAEAGDEGTRIPVTVAHGRSPGPVLALIAGTHGYEYPPILALHRVRRTLDVEKLSGTLILVHIANLPSFLGRTTYYGPVDGKNLNRMFPGDPEGTLSQRIASVIYDQVIAAADVVVDMHGGDGNEALRPYLYLTTTGDAEFDRRSRDLALAFGLDTVVLQGDWSADPADHVYTEWAALGAGKPAITTETGALGSTDERYIQLAERGVWNLLRHLGMVPGKPEPAPAITWLESGQVVRSPVEGIFEPAVEPGYYVEEGALLGTLVDFFGEPIQPVKASFAGVVNYVIATPPAGKDEPLAMVSRLRPRQ